MIRNRSAVRRLVFMIAWLLVLDAFVPAVVRKLETRRYEHGGVFRFENSDLFGLGPLVTYLREHPRGERPRAVFLGNSMLFGYFLHPSDALPAAYEARRPGLRVFNMAVNGEELGTSFLVSKDIIDSADGIFVQVIGHHANPMLPSLIPVDARDVRAFELQPRDPVEQRLRQWLGRVWRLYRSNERIQAAMFATSTRQYVYLHKREIALALLRPFRRSAPPPPADTTPAPPQRPLIVAPRAAATLPNRANLSRDQRLILEFGDLARAHKKRIVLLEFEYQGRPPAEEVAHFNAAYTPFAERVVVMVPKSLTYDGQHLTAPGGRLVADALARHEAEAERERRR